MPMTATRPLMARTSRFRSRYFAPIVSRTTSAPWPPVASCTTSTKSCFPVVHQDFRAQLFAAREFRLRSGRHRHARAHLPRELDRHRPDAARPAVHEQRLARPQPGRHEDVAPHRAHDLRQRRGVRERHAVRHRQQLAGRDRDALGVAAAGEQRAHLVARRPVAGAVAHGADGAAALQPEVRRRARRRRVEALPLQDVGAGSRRSRRCRRRPRRAPRSGSGTSSSRRFSGPPGSLTTTAFMATTIGPGRAPGRPRCRRRGPRGPSPAPPRPAGRRPPTASRRPRARPGGRSARLRPERPPQRRRAVGGEQVLPPPAGVDAERGVRLGRRRQRREQPRDGGRRERQVPGQGQDDVRPLGPGAARRRAPPPARRRPRGPDDHHRQPSPAARPATRPARRSPSSRPGPRPSCHRRRSAGSCRRRGRRRARTRSARPSRRPVCLPRAPDGGTAGAAVRPNG